MSQSNDVPAPPKESTPVALPSLPARALIGVFLLYKRFLSPLLGANCRFRPSCSSYAIQALQKYGFLWGTVKLVGRVLRCNPLCTGGYDPP